MRVLLSACVAALSFAPPVLADQRTFEFLSRQGCTVSEASKDALANAGFLEPYTNAIVEDALARGLARQQGQYVVLDKSICTIKLPDIQTTLVVDSPEIRAIAPYTRDEYVYAGETTVNEGCFLKDAVAVFEARANGDLDRGTTDYLNFLAAGIISGELRFFSPNPLETPVGFQSLVGDCAMAPNVPVITPSHDFIESHFGEYVRAIGEATECGGAASASGLAIAAEFQGQGIDVFEPPEPTFNAWLFFEYDLITMAAGWHEGLSASERGTPRPPLCHYPD